MGFWSALGKVAKIAAPIASMAIPIPGVGPAVGGLMSKLGGAAASGMVGKIAGAAASGIGAATSAAANNRGAQVDAGLSEEDRNQGRERLMLDNDQNAISAGNLNRAATNDYHVNSVAREAEGRSERNDAFKGLQRAEYVANRTGYVAPEGSRTFGFGPKAATADEKTGAAALKNEVMARLQGGNTLPTVEKPSDFVLPSAGRSHLYDTPYKIDPNLLKQSIWEKIGNVAGPVLATGSSTGIFDGKVKPKLDPYEPDYTP
jgi:hypothetical protein